jgi:hypothetical protein
VGVGDGLLGAERHPTIMPPAGPPACSCRRSHRGARDGRSRGARVLARGPVPASPRRFRPIGVPPQRLPAAAGTPSSPLARPSRPLTRARPCRRRRAPGGRRCPTCPTWPT